jgi:hypothetical protein
MDLMLFYKKSFKALLLFLFYIPAICCNMPKDEQQNASNDNFEKPLHLFIPDTLNAGILYPKVLINNDELNTFAIYLPKIYNNTAAWPVVFFFDAGGNGSIAIQKYKSIADSLGYIMIGSNVSKNGQTAEESLSIWQLLKNSCLNSLSIDKNRIILAGFSGGARVCCTIAANEPEIFGIIANSAGAQQLDNILNQNTMFIGLAGNGDMNRAEMLGIEQHLLGTSLTHYYIEYDGIHEWAPAKIMHKALVISSIYAYQKNPTTINALLIENFISSQKSEIEKLKADDKLLEAYNELVLLKKSTSSLNTLPIENLDSLENNPNYIGQKNELLKITAQETEIQQVLYKMMIENPNKANWKVKIAQIRKSSIQKNKHGQMNQRILGYASLVCYSLSNRNLVSKNYSQAEIMIDCYEIADPENAEVYYFKAIVNGAKREKDNTLLNLQKSIQLGLKDMQRIKTQQEFNFLLTDNEFKKMTNNGQF